MNPESLPGQPAVPRQVFEEFLNRLAAAEASDEVVERLRRALLGGESITESAIRSAIFPTDDEP